MSEAEIERLRDRYNSVCERLAETTARLDRIDLALRRFVKDEYGLRTDRKKINESEKL